MNHDHQSHPHGVLGRALPGYGRAFAIGIALNIAYILAEAAGGLLAGSLALTACGTTIWPVSHDMVAKPQAVITKPDVIAAKLTPLVHFLDHGVHEWREPNPFFRGAWYVEHYPDVAASGANPLTH